MFDMDIDTEKLIKAIKMRPALYNKNDKLNSLNGHRQNKEKLWREISKEFHGNWNQLSRQHKVEFASNESPLAPDFQPFQEAPLLNPIVTPSCSTATTINPLVASKPTTSRDAALLHSKPRKPVECSSPVQKLKNRWRNLRGSFTKERAKQEKENLKRKTGQLVKRRKRYEYFDSMLFLMDTTNSGDETRDSDDSADPLDSSCQPEEMISDYDEPTSDVKNVHTMKTIPEQNYPQKQVVYERNNTLEEKVLDMLKDIKKDEDDEDRQFILSLVPTFRKLNEKQKLTTRIEILKVLQNISFEQN